MIGLLFRRVRPPSANARPSADRGTLGFALVAVVVAIALLGPLLSVSSYDFVARPFQSASGDILLGADVLGRDALSRVLDGGFSTLLLSALATTLGVVFGAFFGICAGYAKGRWDEGIMRTLDVLMAFPQIILAMLFVSIMGPKVWLIVAIVAAMHAPQVARVVRAATIRITEEDYVRHAEMIGASPVRIVLRELLPNVTTPIAVEFGLRLTYSIALIAGLNFLGLGIQPPAPDWGVMISENRVGIVQNPWPVVAPIVLIAMLTVGINLVIDNRLLRRRGSRQRTDTVRGTDTASETVAALEKRSLAPPDLSVVGEGRGPR